MSRIDHDLLLGLDLLEDALWAMDIDNEPERGEPNDESDD